MRMVRTQVFGWFIAFAIVIGGSTQLSIANEAVEKFSLVQVRAMLEQLEVPSRVGSISSDHPDYPLISVVRALQADKMNRSKEVISLLEEVLPQIKYDGIKHTIGKMKSGDRVDRLWLGTYGSFDLWREVIYSLLGRAYYRQEQYNIAQNYFNGVPSTSPFYAQALLGSAWTSVHLKDLAQARKTLAQAALKQVQGAEAQEYNLLNAYISLAQGDSNTAIRLANGVQVTPFKLSVLKSKILAQAGFDQYLKNQKKWSFDQNVDSLRKITQVLDGIPEAGRDADLGFLGAEIYWHLASNFRIKEPEKFRPQWTKALGQGNQWLGPYIDRSIKVGEAALEEDAYFLSVALLWEQGIKTPAIPRLKAIAQFFPSGEYAEDTYQLLADYYYDSGEFKQAVHYYRKLAQAGEEEKAAYGVYKSAWAFYNMEEKWTALRHLERLLVHYRAELNGSKQSSAGSLVVEARKDMLLIMAELLPYRQAFSELGIFGFSPSTMLKIQEEMAHTYKKIGKYEDSIAIWSMLLDRGANTDKGFEWLDNLLLTQLSSGKRSQLAETIKRYYPKLPPKNKSERSKQHQKLELGVEKLILTVHREARKTDDKDIWKATDQLYQTFAQVFSKSDRAEVWYYGAQRKEKLKQTWESIAWYQRAAMIKDFEASRDAALSVLRIVKNLADEKSLKNGQGQKAAYQRLANASLWYIQAFSKTKERTLAEFLYLESLLEARELSQARQYLLSVTKAEGPNKSHRDQFLAHNRKLYQERNWTEGYELNRQMRALLSQMKLTEPEEKSFANQVHRFEQETAFQQAFIYDPTRTKKRIPKEIALARKWYKNVILSGADPSVSMKAWFNRLQTFQLPGEARAMVSLQGEFESSVQANRGSASPKATQNLILDSYKRIAQGWISLGEYLNEAETISRGAQYETSTKKRFDLLWKAATIYGSYYELKKMLDIVGILQKQNAPLLKEYQNMLFLARLFYWNKANKASWTMIRPIVLKDKVPPQIWILVADLFVESQGRESPLNQEITQFLTKNYERLKEVSILKPIWVKLYEPNFDSKIFAKYIDQGNRKPASSLGAFDQPPHVQLQGRLELVSKVLNQLVIDQQELKKYVTSGIPQIQVDALCAAPYLTIGAGKQLRAYSSPPIKSPQWPAFVQRLNNKVEELQTTAKREVQNCREQKDATVFLPLAGVTVLPLCDSERCFPEKPATSKDVLELEASMDKLKLPNLQKVYQFLDTGAWATAEWLSYSAKTVAERSLLLGFIRFALGDTWNAGPLLKEAAKSKEWRSHAQLFLAASAYQNGHFGRAKKEISRVSQNGLLGWERKLYNDIRSSNNQENGMSFEIESAEKKTKPRSSVKRRPASQKKSKNSRRSNKRK